MPPDIARKHANYYDKVLASLKQGGWGKTGTAERLNDMVQLRLESSSITTVKEPTAAAGTTYNRALFDIKPTQDDKHRTGMMMRFMNAEYDSS